MKIIYEDNHLLIVEKPINIPVCEDNTKDTDLLTILKNYIKKKYNKPKNVYLGLVHRLDRPVGGIMVFAKTSKAASRLSEQIRNHQFQKEYFAIVEGKLLHSKGKYQDFLLKDHNQNMSYVNEKGKEAILYYEVLQYNQEHLLSLVKIRLETGRSHQIRVQFAHHGNPLYGDQKYNKNARIGEQIALFSKTITFLHPITKEQVVFDLAFPNVYPWSIFK